MKDMVGEIGQRGPLAGEPGPAHIKVARGSRPHGGSRERASAACRGGFLLDFNAGAEGLNIGQIGPKMLGPCPALETLSFIPAFAIVQLTPRDAVVFIVVVLLAVALVASVLMGGVMWVDHIFRGNKKQ